MNRYLEALERLAMPDDIHIKECERLGIGLTEDYDLLEQYILKTQEPRHYLKWEDLKFSYGEWNKIEVYQGNEKLGISYKSDFDFFDNSYEVVKIYNLKTKSRICKIYDRDKQFFNNLHLEVVDNE